MNTNTLKIDRFRRGFELTKSSWHTLRLDKRLMLLPVLSIVCSVVAIIVLIAGCLGILVVLHGGHNFSSSNPAPFIVLAACFYIVLALIGNFFGGAIIYGATQRFRGGSPTVRSSLAGAKRRFGSLALFSFMLASVGLVLQTLENRVPLVGKFAVGFVGAAWSIANVFAVPIIVLNDKNVRPLEATRESVKIIRKVWGESVVADLGISLIGLLGFIGYVAFWVAFGFFDAQVGGMPTAVRTVIFLIAILGFITLLVLVSVLTNIAKAALYHYAITGEAPELFDQRLLQASMTPKKARRTFA